MKDYLGNEVEIGDQVTVAIKNYRGLITATVVGIANQFIVVEHQNTWHYKPDGDVVYYHVQSHQFVKQNVLSSPQKPV